MTPDERAVLERFQRECIDLREYAAQQENAPGSEDAYAVYASAVTAVEAFLSQGWNDDDVH